MSVHLQFLGGHLNGIETDVGSSPHPEGMSAISRGLSKATPPEEFRSRLPPGVSRTLNPRLIAVIPSGWKPTTSSSIRREPAIPPNLGRSKVHRPVAEWWAQPTLHLHNSDSGFSQVDPSKARRARKTAPASEHWIASTRSQNWWIKNGCDPVQNSPTTAPSAIMDRRD